MEEALFITKFYPKVYIFVRSDEARLVASKIIINRAKTNSKIEFMFNTEVKEVLGQDSVSGIKVFNNKTNEELTLDNVKGLFMAIGHEPNTKFLKGFLELGTQDYVIPTDNTKTPKKGVFVAGDVSDWKYRQAVTAAGLGCMAAIHAERLLAEE
jgi:thioredoxin reductase (NADPH)